MNKKFLNNKKKAFTLIELLIVIAIIGILFIVLVSKVDFATDKAKATGVQTDFRSFQMAFEQVAKENAGFNTFGWDEGDNAGAIPTGYAFENEAAKKATMGDGIRNSYDEGDKNLNGKQDVNGVDGYTGTTEVWTGRKIYTETWTDVWTLVRPGTTKSATLFMDEDAVFALESAINANLDPKLHITINALTGNITMANQARDPWKNEYVGQYLTNASLTSTTNTVLGNQPTADTVGGDRGAIVMYSKGANGKLGCVEEVVNGSVVVTVLTSENSGTPNKTDNNVAGKDDYSIATIYTFKNGYGEVISTTTGFSNNQTSNEVVALSTGKIYPMLDGANQVVDEYRNLSFRSEADFDDFVEVKVDGNTIASSNYEVSEGSTIVTLKDFYVRTLSDGTHKISIVSTDGAAHADFTVNAGNCIDKNVGVKTNVTLRVENGGAGQSFVVESTEAKSLYELCRMLIDENKLDRYRHFGNYHIDDGDLTMYYVNDNGKLANMNNVPVESNKTYTFYHAQFGKVFHENPNADLDSIQYKTIWVDYSMVYSACGWPSALICPVFAGVDDTYLDLLYHAPLRVYYPEPDPRLAAAAESDIVSNKLWILYPGFESFGTTINYFIVGVSDNNGFKDLSQKTSDGEYASLYCMMRDGEAYTDSQVIIEMMDFIDGFNGTNNSIRYGVMYSALIDDVLFHITFFEDGTVCMGEDENSETAPAGLMIITNNVIYVQGYAWGEVSIDGSYLTLDPSGEGEYITLYAQS